jgi:hypothetical protein
MRASALQRLFTFSFAFMLCYLGVCYAQQSKELAGKWNMVSTTPDGDQISWVLQIRHENGNYTATVDGQDGSSAAKDFRVENGKVHFRTTYQDQDYDIDLTIEENRLIGTWSGNGDSGETKGTKAVGPTAG